MPRIPRPKPAGSQRQPPSRIRIEQPSPRIDCGRYPPKRCEGDSVEVSAEVLRDGHDVLRAVVRWRGPLERRWQEAPMRPIDAHLDGVRWAGSFAVQQAGRWEWTIEAWNDAFATWREELQRKLDFGQHGLASELSEGALLLRDAAKRTRGEDRRVIDQVLALLEDPHAPEAAKHDMALGHELLGALERHPDRSRSTSLEHPLTLDVDRARARFGAWYELFPRSWGGFTGVREQLPRFAALGVDVLYLTPIHPIGQTARKGRDGALLAGPGDPGSPWAIGGADGGHEALDPRLGTLEEFEELVASAQEHGVEIALDLAIHCSADHPWLRTHPEWFMKRPDGTLKYAENPPKKYQDIYNLDFDCEDWRALWEALRELVLLWVARGVRIFRVDNPHTKPFAFWEWLIADVRARHPDVIFLAEAFTRKALMRELAKLGFDQSYTYFTWKNSRAELTEYVSELALGQEREYLRPNFFVNTPDILSPYLQQGGRPAFEARLVLAATMSPAYGVYSGFEHCENVPLHEGSEEYLHSEKYELKQRRLDGPLLGLLERLNTIRRENAALQELANIRFLDTANDALIAYVKQTGENVIITVVNIDFRNAQEGLARVPAELGLPVSFDVLDLLDASSYAWRTGENFVRLEPGKRVAHVMQVQRP
ncbi:MAG: alpha-1,4-glucan--maltose-1-phosphate maltosyltransferase [Solirubrobacteraceae bacterium]